ncbi:acetylcholinesterase-like isoform X1 [Penaeus japonicus]|uniref:acetylcholinesterase-like isoform X1 n=1 Tax=Penaeus japonicus TaxID=27405 RepID=UPI001C70DCC7|nr:acetylcholinesterase-like isoform X1 [Penaeus japonicus]
MQQKHMREYRMSEDCLTLNIYTPLPESRRGKTNASELPVLVYIHGGSFYSNGGRLYPGEKLASEGIVVVTINYRLGPFGFLSTGDGWSRGNWGLLDQRMALLWVRRHASAFGGHKDKILLVGNSAGAASVILHLVSPLSQDLFSRAAALSGCALAPWSLQSRPLHFAQQLAAGLECPVSPSSELVDCLRRQEAQEINQIYAKDYIQDGLWLAFAPVVEGDFEGAFLPRSPRTLLEEGSLPPIPLIMTLTKDEVSIWFREATPSTLSPSSENRTIELSKAEDWLDIIMKQKFPDLEPRALAAVLHAVRAAYIYRNGYTTKVPVKIISELISDLGLRVPCVEEAGLLSHWTRLYFAEFSYVSPDDVRVGSQKWIGSYHESDLQFVFGQPFLGLANTLRGPKDRSVATTIMSVIISFAHTGVPELGEMEWPAYNLSHLVHLELSEQLSLSHNLVQHSLCFWQRFIPLMTLFPMKPPEEEPNAAPPFATPPVSLLLLSSVLHRAFT